MLDRVKESTFGVGRYLSDHKYRLAAASVAGFFMGLHASQETEGRIESAERENPFIQECIDAPDEELDFKLICLRSVGGQSLTLTVTISELQTNKGNLELKTPPSEVADYADSKLSELLITKHWSDRFFEHQTAASYVCALVTPLMLELGLAASKPRYAVMP